MMTESSPRVLLVEYVLFTEDIATAFSNMGFAIVRTSPEELTVDKFSQLCTHYDPQFVFSVNYSPELAYLAGINDRLYISWTVDPLPTNRFKVYKGTQVNRCVLFGHDPRSIKIFRQLGFRNSFVLPLAASNWKRYPLEEREEDTQRYNCPVSFVGSALSSDGKSARKTLEQRGCTSRDLQELDEWLKTYAEDEADNAAFYGFLFEPEKLPTWVAERIPAGMSTKEFYRNLDAWLSMYVRIHRVLALQQQGIHVYGGSGWVPWTHCYKGFAHHQKELTKIYNASTVNLDIPRLYQRNIITMRVFDVLACRAVVITEPPPQLLKYFEPGKDLFIYRNTTEMQNVLQYIWDNPGEAKQVAHNGYSKVSSHHLVSQRVKKILHKTQQLGFETNY